MEYEYGVIVDPQGFFVSAVKWDKSAGVPPINGPRTAGAASPRLRLLRTPEAIADPVPGGKWDAKKKVWQRPNVEIWIVNVRRDLPRYGSLAGSKMVFRGRLPNLPQWQRYIEVPPPESRASVPLWDFETNEWITPVRVVEFDDAGVCTNIVVKPRLEEGDVEPFDVEDEAGNVSTISPGVPLIGGHTPRYKKVPVRAVRKALEKHNLFDDFERYLIKKGLSFDQFDDVERISLNNKLLREFVRGQNLGMKQAYEMLQKTAEDLMVVQQEIAAQITDED